MNRKMLQILIPAACAAIVSFGIMTMASAKNSNISYLFLMSAAFFAWVVYQSGVHDGILRAKQSIPEGCKLVAAWGGDGWSLEVHKDDEVIAYLGWPESWPAHMKSEDLVKAGFELA